MAENEKNEKLYQSTMAFARSLLKKKIITTEEYRQIDAVFTQKYNPSSGALLADISLILSE